MISLPAVVDTNGIPIPLDSQLGSPGGEGTVFALANDPQVAAKVYHSHVRTPELFEKLASVIGLKNTNPKLLEVAA